MEARARAIKALTETKNAYFDHVVRVAGGVREMARDLGVTRIAVQQWRRRGWMPIERARQCRDLYGSGILVKHLVDPKLAAIFA